jgi:hypothetical protein
VKTFIRLPQRFAELCPISLFFLVTLTSILILQGCGSSSSSTADPVVTISISPTTTSVATTKTQQFTATVSGTTNTAVTWQVNGATGGDATHGTISTAGVYTAPAAVPTPAAVTVTAVAQADSTQSVAAVVTITATGGSNITVSVSPRRGGLTVTQTLSIAATLANDTTNAGVSWSSSGGGSFSPATSTSGNSVTFTAPSSAGILTITATSVADGSKTASATIGVTDLTAVSTYLNENSRQGGNLQEHALTTSGPTAVNSTNFGKLFSCTVDAAIYAQPLWVANLTIGGAKHNVVFVATQHDTVYAFDADANASPCVPLWTASLLDTAHGGASGETFVTSSDVGCADLAPDIGIVGTPVIDLSSNTIYVVSKTRNPSTSPTFHQRLHALDITSGNERVTPTEISATVPGTGAGSTGSFVSFDPLVNNERSALLLMNGHVIISWGSHCDNGTYRGWVMSYSSFSATPALSQEAILNLSPNGINAGIWMSGNGPAADASGNMYFATGNGTFDANTSGSDFGDSIIKLGSPSGGKFSSLSYFRSFQQQPSPDIADVDQGSGGVLLLPTVGTKNYLVQAGKDGQIYVMDQATSLGGFNTTTNNVIQEVSGQLPGGIWGSATYWNGNIYYGAAQDLATSDPMRAFSFDNVSTSLISTTPTSSTTKIFGFSGPTPPISSNGASNGIAWALDNVAYCTNQATACGPAVLHAYDATNLATELWNSTQGTNNTAGNAVKFTVPTVANGKVYVGTRGNNTGGAASSTSVPGELDIYGLLP